MPSTASFWESLRQDPYPFYRELRHHNPVWYPGPFGSYVVSRYQDVQFVLKNPAIFSSVIMARADHVLLGADPPDHTRVRFIVNRFFSIENAAHLEADIRIISERFVEQLLQHQQVDLVKDFATPIPIAVIAKVLGIHPKYEADLKRWSDAVVSEANSFFNTDPTLELRATLRELEIFLETWININTDRPQSEFAEKLFHRDGLSSKEIRSFVRLLLIAGAETTTNLVGNALLTGLRFPTELESLQSDLSLVPSYIEETLRYESPVQILQRITLHPVRVVDLNIPAHALILVVIGSANRDEQVFNNPDIFSPRRISNNHLSFGVGPHYCLGATIARLEAVIALETLMARVKSLKLNQSLDKITYIETLQLRGPSSLLVSLKHD